MIKSLRPPSIRFSLLLLSAVLALGTSVSADPTLQADDLIAAAKNATGGKAWDSIITWHEEGTGLAGGLTGTYYSWVDFPTLRNTGGYVLGPDSGGSGWDRIHVWTTDSSKEVRIEASDEATSEAIQDAYRGAYAFYFPDRFPAKREEAGERSADGIAYDAVKVTPQGADPFEIWFDRKTHRIEREVQLTGDHPHTFLSEDYGPFGDVMVPRKSIDRVGKDSKFDIVFMPKTIAFTGAEETARYAPPPPPANSAHWPDGKDSITVPFQLFNNHIYVDVSINGSAPLPFVFDTGATNVLDNDTAHRLGIKVEGALPMTGFGDTVSSSGMAKVTSVGVGGLALPDQVFMTEGSSGWVAIEGTPSCGLIGYEFAKRAVVSIDYAAHTMTFTKPSAFQPPANVTPIPFTFAGHTPMLPGTLDGASGQFELDTGSRGAVTVMAPFAAAHHLVEKTHARVTGTVGYGVGGPARAMLGRGESLVLGPVTITSPVTEFTVNKAGGGNEQHTAGNIGGDVLKRFTVTLDYAHQLAWLQPNAANDSPEVFDRSGLWIARSKSGAIEIDDVTSESPAAKLGLAVGDEILSIDGKSAAEVPLPALREKFKGAIGTRFQLRVKAPSGEKDVTLVLAEQV
jgi:hypothetical protein